MNDGSRAPGLDQDELLDGLASGVLPETLPDWARVRGVLPIFELVRSLCSSTPADTALKLLLLLELSRADGRFGRERIRSLVPAVAPDRLDALVTSLYRGGWLELRAVDNTYRLPALAVYLLSVLLAADFGSQSPANLLIRAVETIAYGGRVDPTGGTTGQLLAMLLAELETQADVAREIIGHGTPRQLIRFSREEVRGQVQHVLQVLAAIEERLDESSEQFARIVRIHAALQEMLRAHEGLARRLTEWNLKRLETSDAGYSLAALSDAVVGASNDELLALVAGGVVRPNASAVGLSTDLLLTRHRTGRPGMVAERAAFRYDPPPEPDVRPIELVEIDPVSRLLDLLARSLNGGGPIDLSSLLAGQAEDFADAVFLLNLVARIQGREATAGIELAPGLVARIRDAAVEPAMVAGLAPQAAIERLEALGVLVDAGAKGRHSALTLSREPLP